MDLQVLHKFSWTWMAPLVIGLVTYVLARRWWNNRGLPPGPFPFPIVGNLRELKTNPKYKLSGWRAKHGDVFTLWLGSGPTVVVCGFDRIKESLIGMKNAFSGRNCRHTGKLFLNGHNDIIMTNYSPLWDALRKMFVVAIRKYAISDKLPILVDDVLNEAATLMLAEKDVIDPSDFLYLTVYNIIASTAFGKRYNMKDEEFLKLKYSNDEINNVFNSGSLWDVYPFMRYFMKKKENRLKELISNLLTPIRNQYKSHKASYDSGTIRDFTDACLAAQEEAKEEEKGTEAYFTDENMVLVLWNFFVGGTDTTRVMLSWTVMYLAKHQEVQDKLRQEVLTQIGNRIPVQEDKHKCPYAMAVITEMLRLRPILSFTPEHKTTCDVEFAGYSIPKDTCVIFHIVAQHMDPKYFEDPEEFRPERFIADDGSLKSTIGLKGYMPFSLGRRACPGEKLAMVDLFLLLTGLVRRCKFLLPDGPNSNIDLEPMSEILSFQFPKPCKLKVIKI